MHYVAPGVYLDRATDGSLTLLLEDVVVHDGKPLKLRVKRVLQTEKLRTIVPELFPVSSPSIAEDVVLLRELIEWMKLPGQVVGGGEGADAALLIERVLDHYLAVHEASPFNFAKPENVKGFEGFLNAIERSLEDSSA